MRPTDKQIMADKQVMTDRPVMREAPNARADSFSLERIFVLGAALAVFMGVGAVQAAAQDEGFLFGTPKGSLALKVGYHIPRAQSDLFVFTQDELTVEDGDFNGVGLAGELGVRITERLDLTASVGFSESRTRSEFRDWVDESDLPIEQETRFSVVPLTVGFKTYLSSRGRRVGRLAWVPSENKVNPYVGGAVGVTYYQFEQFGDFIDFETLDIFPDNFYSEGTAPTAHVLGGVDVGLSPRVYFTAEGRYGWASAPLDGDFVGFEDLDLAGFHGSVGIGFRF